MLKKCFVALLVTLVVSLSSFIVGCENIGQKIVMPVITEPDTDQQDETPNIETDTEPVETVEPYDELYEESENVVEPLPLEPQIITVRNMIVHTTSSDAKQQGIGWVYAIERFKTIVKVDLNLELDDDGIEDGYTIKNFINGIILPPTKLEDYHYLPFKDANNNFTIKVGDQIEVIQHEIDKRLFRIIRNITRPEVDYSIFW